MADIRVGGAFIDFLARNHKFIAATRANGQALRNQQRRVRELRRDVAALNTQVRGMVRIFSVAAVAGIGLAIRQFATFGETMAKVRGIAGATTEQFELLEKQALDLGRRTRFTANEAAEGQLFLARAGFEVGQIYSALPGTLRLAQAATVSVAQAADFTSNALAAFGASAAETDRFVDVMAKATTSANTDLVQLAEGLKLVAPVAKALNVSFETTSAAIGVLSDAGLQATLAGTGLRKVLFDLQDPTTRTKEILEELGLSVSQVSVEQNGLIKVIERLSEAGIDATQIIEVFGKRGAPAFLNLVRNLPKLRELTAELQNSAGTAAELARIQDATLNGSFLRLRSAAEGFGLELFKVTEAGEQLQTSLDSLAMRINSLTDSLARNVHRIRHGFQVLIVTLIYFSKVGRVVRGSLRGIRSAALAARVAVKALSRAIALVFVIEGIVLLGKYLFNLRDTIEEVGTSWKNVALVAATDFIAAMINAFASIPALIATAIAATGQILIDSATGLGKLLYEGVVAGFTGQDIGTAITKSFKESLATAQRNLSYQINRYKSLINPLPGLSEDLAQLLGVSEEQIASAREARSKAFDKTVAEFKSLGSALPPPPNAPPLVVPAPLPNTPPLVVPPPTLPDELKKVTDEMRRMKSVTNAVGRAFEELFTNALRGWKDLRKSIADVAEQLSNDLLRALIITPLRSEVENFFQAQLAPAAGSATSSGSGPAIISGFSPPPLQHGGLAHGLALVGEGGVELADFRRPARIYSNEDLRAAIAGGGKGDITLNVNVAAGVDEGMVRQIVVDDLLPVISDAVQGSMVRAARRPSGFRRALRAA